MYGDLLLHPILKTQTFTPIAHELRIHEHTRSPTDCWAMPKMHSSLPHDLLYILIPQPKSYEWLPTRSLVSRVWNHNLNISPRCYTLNIFFYCHASILTLHTSFVTCTLVATCVILERSS